MDAHYDVLPSCRPYAKNAGFVEFSMDWYFVLNGKKIWIPKGYWMNGASIPRPFWPIIGSPFEPDLWAGAGAHDYLYLTHIRPREESDEVLFQLCRQSKVGLWRARTIWRAVRTFAGFAWNNNQRDLEELGDLRVMIAARPDRDKFEV